MSDKQIMDAGQISLWQAVFNVGKHYKNYKEPSHIKTISVPRKLEIKIVFIWTNYNSIISFLKKVTSLKFPEETKFIFI